MTSFYKLHYFFHFLKRGLNFYCIFSQISFCVFYRIEIVTSKNTYIYY